uniref:Uncharacterized protein n=2 Tax=Graphocephala atropunctata TaxID=36148 RepID=A0A1B6LJ36_9HEMI
MVLPSVFKIPQMKLDPQMLNHLHNGSKGLDLPSSPQSPVLSGQILHTKVPFVSPESPILTRQITLSSKCSTAKNEGRKAPYCESPDSPILSSQVLSNKSSSVVKIGRKVLFSENEMIKQNSTISNISWCKPLDNGLDKNQASVIQMETEDDNMLSVSQIFDEDSNEGNMKNNLDQSSMYTISQMVTKVTALAKNPTHHNSTFLQSTKCVTFPETNGINFGSSDEDSLFENINLDDYSEKKDNPNTNVAFSGTKKLPPNNMTNSESFTGNCSLRGTQSTKKVQESTNPEIVPDRSFELYDNKNSSNSSLKSQQDSVLNIFEEPNKTYEESSITSRWSSCMKPRLCDLKTSTPHVQVNDMTNLDSDSDSVSDVFQSPLQRRRNRSPVNLEKNQKKEKKRQLFVEMEADVTGPRSSDEDSTSGLDDLDESFINDMTEHPNTTVDQTMTDMQARYLQSVKSPMRKPGGFKIPTVSDSVLAQDVFSQFVEEEEDTYLNDSFCCDATEIPMEEEPSVLEIAEQILNKGRKTRKVNRKRRKRKRSDSSSDDTDIDQRHKVKRLLNSESSDEDQVMKNCKRAKRKQFFNSDSSSQESSLSIKKPLKRKQIHLLTSDSDSDRTL